MNYLNDFITEIQKLEITGEKYLTLNHYNQIESDYESRLKRLQQLALNDILLLSKEQIKMQLTRFQQINERFTKFWKLYKELLQQFKAGKLMLTDLELKLYPLFIVPKHTAKFISQEFLSDLHDAVMFKDDIFSGFQSQVEQVMNEYKTDFEICYNNEVTEERKQKLHERLATFKTNAEKISFLEEQKILYLRNLPVEILNVSGTCELPNFKKGEPLFWDRYLQNEIDNLSRQVQKETKTKTDTPKAPVLGIFCNLINEIGIEEKGEAESAETFCKRICELFNLPYSDRVRQNFNANKTIKHLKELKEKILPSIDYNFKLKIENHLATKYPPKQNLYA